VTTSPTQEATGQRLATRGLDGLAQAVRDFYDTRQDEIERRRQARRYFYERLARQVRALVPAGQRVLDLGCGSGDLLAAVQPSEGVGIDLAPAAVARAQARYGARGLRFVTGDAGDPAVLAQAGGPFDVILLVNVLTHLTDVQATLQALHAVCHARTRLVIYSYSRLWQPLLRAAELLRLKLRQPAEAWLPPEEVRALLHLADFECVRRETALVCPVGVPLIAEALNRYIAPLPVLGGLSLMYGLVARPTPARLSPASHPSVSVVIPCRNEAGHVRPLVERLPRLTAGSEFIFVEGHSTDDTEGELRRVIAAYPELPLRFLKQPGKGKGDAVRAGFALASGDVLLILDSDMGVAPEDVPKFVDVLARGKGEMINGSRLVYPMDGKPMRFLNLVANKGFAWLFSWLLGQQVRDTLCGTKVLWRSDYERIAANRSFFGDFDPFGDFDLLFGAARLNLRIVDLAVRYHERLYGDTNISRFSHGLLLLRMSLFAARKLKFV
jgi:2-polyprenyl-3-methyl-5-hydroxy-6-metoxy-1,4-benzoquinol methylase